MERDQLTGENVEVLWVKGSGGDLRTSNLANFASLYQQKLLSLQKTYDGDERKTDIRRRPDEAGQQGPVVSRPCLHHQRDSQRPFAAHAEGRDKPQRAQVPGLLREKA